MLENDSRIMRMLLSEQCDSINKPYKTVISILLIEALSYSGRFAANNIESITNGGLCENIGAIYNSK
jgi:hypothetical protein